MKRREFITKVITSAGAIRFAAASNTTYAQQRVYLTEEQALKLIFDADPVDASVRSAVAELMLANKLYDQAGAWYDALQKLLVKQGTSLGNDGLKSWVQSFWGAGKTEQRCRERRRAAAIDRHRHVRLPGLFREGVGQLLLQWVVHGQVVLDRPSVDHAGGEHPGVDHPAQHQMRHGLCESWQQRLALF